MFFMKSRQFIGLIFGAKGKECDQNTQFFGANWRVEIYAPSG
jgi:hypothetical protein